MHTRRAEGEAEKSLKFSWCFDIRKWRHVMASAELCHMINQRTSHFKSLFSPHYHLSASPKIWVGEGGWQLPLLWAGRTKWATGKEETGGGGKRMNNLRVMPRDLRTFFVLPLIWIPEKAVVMTGSLSSPWQRATQSDRLLWGPHESMCGDECVHRCVGVRGGQPCQLQGRRVADKNHFWGTLLNFRWINVRK